MILRASGPKAKCGASAAPFYHRPLVGQVRRNQHQAQHNAHDRGTAELFAGRPGHQHRNKGVGRIGEHGVNLVKFRGEADAESADEQAPQAHQDTGGQQHWDDGDENIRNHLGHALEGDFLAAGGRNLFPVGQAGHLLKFGADFINKAGAQNHLVLAALAEIACHTGDLQHRLLVHKGRIFQPYPQTGCTVGGADNIVLAAECVKDRLCGGNRIFFHNRNLHI